ncbi:MAG: serine protease AprX [Chitinophagales bacterium]
MRENKNPIKHVKFSDVDYFQPENQGGGNSKPHKPITDSFKAELIDSIEHIRQEFSGKIDKESLDVAAAIVELEEKATAKSNRPTNIFSEDTCPFFGDMGYAKLLVQISASGLQALQNKIEKAKSKQDIKELSAIKSISVYKPTVNIDDYDQPLSVRLFRFRSNLKNAELDQKFESYLNSNGCEWIKHPSNAVRLYRVKGNTNYVLDNLSKFIGVQSAISSRCIKVKPLISSGASTLPVNIFPPDADKEYPIVAVVDSGVSNICWPIEPWIVGRESYVAPEYKDDSHGTFVGGLVSNSLNLNGLDPRFPKCQAKVLSVEVLGRENGDLYEIISAMHEVAQSNEHIKVWNLSLGSSSPVSMAEISQMALLLDEFQDKFNCLCIVAAGNYEESFRSWPPSSVLNDGISSPGDSVRSLTVGSLAHIDGFVKNNEPSHFSRKGPVSNYVQKPEVVHYGGNVMMIGGQPTVLGVNSIDVTGLSRSDIGTSFSTPLVSAVAANLFHQIKERANPSLIKALIVHSANLNYSVDAEYKPYYGWGVPKDSEDILSVNDYESTIVFEGVAKASFEINKLPFPIPQCLRTEDGKVRAEFFITLVYQPELDPNRAFEYCQVDLQLGFGRMSDDGRFKSMVPLQKGTHEYETDLVKSGDKWSPVKVYQNRFPNGVDVENWKLRVSVLGRDGYDSLGILIPFTIVLTIRDIDKEQPVYNEMSILMDNYNWEVTDLIVDNQIRI